MFLSLFILNGGFISNTLKFLGLLLFPIKGLVIKRVTFLSLFLKVVLKGLVVNILVIKGDKDLRI